MTPETARRKQLIDALKDVNESFQSLRFAISCIQHLRHPSDFDLHERLDELESIQKKINEDMKGDVAPDILQNKS